MRQSNIEQEEAGEGYFASISDLMVGILFIFLLMLAVFAINYASEDKDQRIRDLEKQVAELTAELSDKDREILRLSNAAEELKIERDRLRNGLAELIKQLEGVTFSLQGAQELVRPHETSRIMKIRCRCFKCRQL